MTNNAFAPAYLGRARARLAIDPEDSITEDLDEAIALAKESLNTDEDYNTPSVHDQTAYLIPMVIFLVGGLLVGVFLWRQTRAAAEQAAEAPPAEPLDPEIERAIDEELAR